MTKPDIDFLLDNGEAQIVGLAEVFNHANNYIYEEKNDDLFPYDGIDIDENTSIIERILNETGKETIFKVLTHLYYFLIDYIGTKIDGYDGDIHEIDTDDYFYGME